LWDDSPCQSVRTDDLVQPANECGIGPRIRVAALTQQSNDRASQLMIFCPSPIAPNLSVPLLHYLPVHDPDICSTSTYSYQPESYLNSSSSRASVPILTHSLSTHQPPSMDEPPSNAQRPHCTHDDCLDAQRHPTKFFSRRADLLRHIRSTHSLPHIDCPWKKCARRGSAGFMRQDHLLEHRRQYHKENITAGERAPKT
jgi:hypothetical protein